MDNQWNGEISKIMFKSPNKFIVEVTGRYVVELTITDIHKLIDLLPIAKKQNRISYEELIGQIITILCKDNIVIGVQDVICPQNKLLRERFNE